MDLYNAPPQRLSIYCVWGLWVAMVIILLLPKAQQSDSLIMCAFIATIVFLGSSQIGPYFLKPRSLRLDGKDAIEFFACFKRGRTIITPYFSRCFLTNNEIRIQVLNTLHYPYADIRNIALQLPGKGFWKTSDHIRLFTNTYIIQNKPGTKDDVSIAFYNQVTNDMFLEAMKKYGVSVSGTVDPYADINRFAEKLMRGGEEPKRTSFEKNKPSR